MPTDFQLRSDAQYVIAEHRRLHRLMTQAHDAIVGFNSPDVEATAVDVVRVLRHVRNELQRHFAQEEADGFLQKAASHSPELAAEARRIEVEHSRLLESTDALIAQYMDTDQLVQKRVALLQSFDELRQHLNAHEVAENTLLRHSAATERSDGKLDQPTLTFDV